MTILKGEKNEVDRLPAMNSVGTYTVECMRAYQAYWPQAHKDPEKMAKLGSALHRLAGLDSVVVPFDLTVEAEVLGAPINFFEDQIRWPTAKRFIAEKTADLKLPKRASDVREEGRVPIICEAIRILKREFEGKVPIIAYVCSPFESVSSYLVDSVEFFKKCKREPDTIHEFMTVTKPYYSEIARAFKEAGADILTIREEAVSLNNIHPKYFEDLVRPYLTDLIGDIHPPRILHTCGQLLSSDLDMVTKLVQCGAEALTIDENTPIDRTRVRVDQVKPGYPIGGNISAYETLYRSPKQKIIEEVRRIIAEGCDMPMPGCDFWLETPTEHIKIFVEATVEYGGK